MFENAWRVHWIRVTDLGIESPVHPNYYGFPRSDVALWIESECLASDALRGNQTFCEAINLVLAYEKWSNSVWVTESNQAPPSNHGYYAVTSLCSEMSSLYGTEDIVLVQCHQAAGATVNRTLNFCSEQIEQRL